MLRTLQATKRLACYSEAYSFIYGPLACLNFRFKRFSHNDAAEMGKEKLTFQLKTPKGTKDCACIVALYNTVNDKLQGMARIWSYETRFSLQSQKPSRPMELSP